MTHDSIAVKLKCPTAPNFVFLDVPGLVSEGGFKECPKVRVADLSDEQKDWLASEWRKRLDDVAKRQAAVDMDQQYRKAVK